MLESKTLELLGRALWCAQMLEWGLYGLASFYASSPEAKKDKRFSKLTPEIFLTPTAENLELCKVTIGQLYAIFGDKFYLTSECFDNFIKQRNLIAHRFYAATKLQRGILEIPDPDKYLIDFINSTQKLIELIQGLFVMILVVATKENKLDEFKLTGQDIQLLGKYEKFLTEQITQKYLTELKEKA